MPKHDLDVTFERDNVTLPRCDLEHTKAVFLSHTKNNHNKYIVKPNTKYII